MPWPSPILLQDPATTPERINYQSFPKQLKTSFILETLKNKVCVRMEKETTQNETGQKEKPFLGLVHGAITTAAFHGN